MRQWPNLNILKPQSPEDPEAREAADLNRRLELLSQYGFWKYSRREHSYGSEAEQAQFQKIQEVLVSPEGLAVAKQVHRAVQQKKFYRYEFEDLMLKPVIQENLSPEALSGLFTLVNASSVKKMRHVIDDIVVGYLGSADLREDFSVAKMESAAKALPIIAHTLDKDLMYEARTVFIHFAHNAQPGDFSEQNAREVCKALKNLSKKHSSSSSMHSLVGALFQSGIVPRQRAFTELETTATELFSIARQKRTENDTWGEEDISALSHLLSAPAIAEGFTPERAGTIFEQVHQKANEGQMDRQTKSAIFGPALSVLLRTHGTDTITRDNWTTLVDKAQELAQVSGKARGEVLQALPQIGRIIDLKSDWKTAINILEKQVRGSIVGAKSLRILQDLQPRDVEMLRFVVARKAGSFLKTLETLGLAKTFGLRLRSQDYLMLQPLPTESLEKIGTLFEQGENGSHFDRFEAAYKHLRESNREVGDEKEVDTTKLRALIDRARKAWERKDLTTAKKLISDLSLQMGNEVAPYLEARLHAGIVRKAKTEFNLESLDEQKLHDPAFIAGYTIYEQMKKRHGVNPSDIQNANTVLANHLAGRENVLTAHPNNRRWLGKLPQGAAEVWMGRNEQSFDLTDEPLADNVLERTQHFSEEALRLFEALGTSVAPNSPPEELIARFRDIRQAGLSAEQQNVYADLKTQIQGLNQILRGSYGGERPKKLVIYRETDPIRILNMGTWVNGSCLDVNGMNGWSTFVNASEANKGVYWITDENDRILGRVLVAVDKNRKLLRFPLYYAGSGLDLNPYVNRYLRSLAKDMRIGVNGNGSRVEKLVCKAWYMDRATPRI